MEARGGSAYAEGYGPTSMATGDRGGARRAKTGGFGAVPLAFARMPRGASAGECKSGLRKKEALVGPDTAHALQRPGPPGSWPHEQSVDALGNVTITSANE